MDILKINKAPSEGNCSKCARSQKQIIRLNKAFIETDDESVRQSMQHEDEISELNDECSYWCMKYEDAKAEIEQLKAEHSSGSQSKEMVLEEVGSPVSNTDLRASPSLNPEVKENERQI